MPRWYIFYLGFFFWEVWSCFLFTSSPLNTHLKHFSTFFVLNILNAEFAFCYCPYNLPHHLRNWAWECFRQQVVESVVDIVSLKWNGLNHCLEIPVSTHSEQLYKEARDTERWRGRWGQQRRRNGYKQMNKWVKWGEGNLRFHRAPLPHTPSPSCWMVECML